METTNEKPGFVSKYTEARNLIGEMVVMLDDCADELEYNEQHSIAADVRHLAQRGRDALQ